MDLDVATADFSPFSSLCEALTYMLVNSPRPIVSLTVLKMLFHQTFFFFNLFSTVG